MRTSSELESSEEEPLKSSVVPSEESSEELEAEESELLAEEIFFFRLRLQPFFGIVNGELLSYCGWDWFEVAEQEERGDEEEEGGIGHI